MNDARARRVPGHGVRGELEQGGQSLGRRALAGEIDVATERLERLRRITPAGATAGRPS